jgi:hypothetical protein
MHKIAIVWSFWVWKTSLTQEIERYSNTDISCYMNFERKVLQDIQWQDDRKQMWLISEQVKQEYLNFKNHYITDTWLITILAYSFYTLKDDEYTAYKHRVKEFLKYYPYTKIFYIPIEFDIENDWFRYIDQDFQKQIDQKIIELLIEFKISFIICSWNLEERRNIIFKNI